MLVDDRFHVIRAAVAYFYVAFVEYLMEIMILGEMLLQ